MASIIQTPTFNLLGSRKAIAPERQALRAVEPRAKGEIAPPDAVLRALDRVLVSDVFRRSTRLSQFFRFTIEQALQGFGENLKEYRIATEVYGRKADFDPSQDTIVRSEARRLRKKLKEYYETDGAHDDIVITLRPGSYLPESRWRTNFSKPSCPPARGLGYPGTCEDQVQVVVKPFLSHAGDQWASALAFGVSDEILHRLMRIAGIRVVWQDMAEQQRSTAAIAAPQIAIDGAVRTVKDRLRVSARVTSADGLILWSQRYETANEAGTPTNFPELVAASIVTRISPRGALAPGYPPRDSYLFYAEALAAEALLEAGSIPCISAALQRFEALAAEAPGYARALCGIAQCCVALSQRGFHRRQKINRKGKNACLAAISSDPGAIHAHSALGCLLAQEWKWKEAEGSFRAALRLGEPHIAHRQFSQFLLAHGRFEEAWTHLQIADETDPFSDWQKLSKARFLYYSRWHPEAEEYYGWLALHGPLPLEVRVLQALTEVHRVDRTKTEWIQRAVSARGPAIVALTAEFLALSGEIDTARSLISNAGLLEKAAAISCFRKAILALALKDRVEALRLLMESWQRQEPELLWVRVDPRFDDIRSEIEYLAICNAVFHTEAAHPKSGNAEPPASWRPIHQASPNRT